MPDLLQDCSSEDEDPFGIGDGFGVGGRPADAAPAIAPLVAARRVGIDLLADSDEEGGAAAVGGPDPEALVVAALDAAEPAEAAAEAAAAEAAAEAAQAVVAPQPGRRRRGSVFRVKAKVGKGRWGSAVERGAACARAREGKAVRRRHASAAIQKALGTALSESAAGSCKKGGNRFARKVSYGVMQKISYEAPSRRFADIAAQFNVSARSVRDIVMFTASWFLQMQLLVLGAVLNRARACKPDFTMSRLSWDETGERITLSVAGASSQQQTSVWHILIARLRFVVAWGRQVYDFSVTLPPLVCPSTSAASVYYQLFQHPFNAAVFHAMRWINSYSRCVISLSETDSAYSNLRMSAQMYWLSPASDFTCHWLCSLHQASLIEAALTASLGMFMISRLYSLSLLLRSGGLFVRMLGRIREALRRGAVYRTTRRCGSAPSQAVAFGKEVAAYVVAHYKRFARSMQSGRQHHWLGEVAPDSDYDSGHDGAFDAQHAASGKRHRLDEFRRKVEAMLAVFNGPWWEDGVYIHYCDGPSCCPNGEESMLRRMEEALVSVVFREVPCTPAASKWTKLGPCCDSIVLGLWLHRVFVHILGALQLKQDQETPEVRDQQADEQYIHDIDYGALQGKRYKIALSFMRDRRSNETLIVLCLALEALRYLSSWLMRRARDAETSDGSAVLDMWFLEMSPLVFTAQYLATLLAGQNDRLMLLWRFSGASSLSEWFQEAPPCLRQLRRAILVVVCWLYRRFTCVMRRFPWRLLVLGDKRVPMTERHALWATFAQARPCCLQPGFARRLHEQHRNCSAEEICESERWVRIWLWFSRVFTMQCADIEWRHGRNRSRSNPFGRTGVAQFAAKYVNAEAKHAHEAALSQNVPPRPVLPPPPRQRQQGAGDAGPGGLDLAGGEQVAAGAVGAVAAPVGAADGEAAVGARGHADAEARRPKRAPTAYDLFRFERLRRERLLGHRPNGASRDFHAATRAEYDALPADRREDLQARADASRPGIAQQRMQRQAAERQQADAQQALALERAQAAQELRPVEDLAPIDALALPQHLGDSAERSFSLNLVLPDHRIVDGGGGHDADAIFNSAAVAAERQQCDPQSWPLSVGMLRTACRAPGGVKERVATFQANANFIAQPTSQDRLFPTHVNYPSECGLLCDHADAASPATKTMYQALLTAFTGLAKRCARLAGDLPMADAVLAMSVFVAGDGDDRPAHVRFFSFPCCSYQSGHHKPTQTFVSMSPAVTPPGAGPGQYGGFELEFDFGEFVQPGKRVRAPINRQHVGALMVLTEQELALALIESVLPRSARQVRIVRLEYDDVTLRRIRVRGQEAENRHLVVEANAPPPKRSGPGGGPGGPGGKKTKLDLSEDIGSRKPRKRAGEA